MSSREHEALLILGDQLFPEKIFKPFEGMKAFMAEDRGLCTHFRYHKKKLVLFLSAMRHFADEGRAGLKLHYHRLNEPQEGQENYFQKLGHFLEVNQIKHLHSFEVADRFFRHDLEDFLRHRKVEWTIHRTPYFCFSIDTFKAHLAKSKKPFMKTFYEGVRRQTKILMDGDKPVGGQFSFDSENRLPYRDKDCVTHPIPVWSAPEPSSTTQEVIRLVEKEFPSHPGSAEGFRYPVTREAAVQHLKQFFAERFSAFGPFEDAILKNESRLFHSVLSPLINMGLLLPKEVILAAVREHTEGRASLASTEGFVRQIIGWREFIRGVDEVFGPQQEALNYFGHERKLHDSWYDGTTGLDVLDVVIRRVAQEGYCHHIERLMVLSNLMLLSGIHPHEAHRWFMEMFVDSADWVMGPNVYGMGQMSDGGLFATKPYICGSNYILKMSDFKEGPWCAVVDGLYWGFIDKHRAFFAKNPRMSMAVKTFDRMNPARRTEILQAAQNFIQRNTY